MRRGASATRRIDSDGIEMAGLFAASSGRIAAIFSARRCWMITASIAITVTAKSIVAITLTWTGMPRWLAPKM